MKFYILFILWLISFNLFSQKGISLDKLDAKTTKDYNEAVKLIKQNKTDKAIKALEKIAKKNPFFYLSKLRMAGIYYERNEYNKAKLIYDEVIMKDPDYDLEVYYAAGLNAHASKDYANCVNYFETFSKYNDHDMDRDKIAIKYAGECRFRDNALKHPKPFDPQPMASQINSTLTEYLPVLTLDEKTIFFTRTEGKNEYIYYSTKKEDGTWNEAVLLFKDPTSLPDYSEGSGSISADGNTLMFAGCGDKLTGHGSCDIYYTRKIDGTWSKPQNMGKPINSNAWDSQPCVLDNGNRILFSSDRKGSLGGHDLWMTKKNKKGKWSVPENLGPEINTSGNEESPFLHPDGKTLYFRSNGHQGMGDYDLYLSKYDVMMGKWLKPENLGYPINTAGNEGSLFVSANGKKAYYASDFKTAGTAAKNADIYVFDLPDDKRAEPVSYVHLITKDADTKKVINPSYILIDNETKDTIQFGDVTNGALLFELPPDHNFALLVEREGYLFQSFHFNTEKSIDKSDAIEIILELVPITTPVEKPIVLNNIFFVSGSSQLLPQSSTEIQKLYELLSQNLNMKIKIFGHTDNVGNDDDNLSLSEARAKAVYDELLKKGISKERLSFEGKGETIPIANNQTEEGRALNRRTEFIVLH